jgi:hypothetical protein
VATSKISTARQALVAVMSGSGWEVRSHNPGDSAGSQSVVYLHEASAVQEWLSMNLRQETIGFGGVARHIVSGASDTDAIAAEDAALAIIADLETAVRTDPTMAGLGFQVEFTGPLESEVLAADAQRVAVATFTVVVRTVL